MRRLCAWLALAVALMAATAPLAAGYDRRWPRNLPGPWPAVFDGGDGPFTFPATPLELHVEIYYSGAWHDITADVRRDGGNGITIERGRADGASKVQYSRGSLTLNNRSGKYSPRNPNSELYGLIGRNTPIRAAVRADIRITGEVIAWPSRWDTTGTDVWIPLQFAGVLRRLSQPFGKSPLRSAPYRATTALDPVAYWPLEDGSTSTQGASALSGGRPMVVAGTVTWADVTGPYQAPNNAPNLLVGGLKGHVAAYTHSGGQSIAFWVRATPSASPALHDVVAWITDSASLRFWYMTLIYDTVGGHYVQLNVNDSTGAAVSGVTLEENVNLWDDAWHLVQIGAAQNGANVDLTLWVDGAQVSTDSVTSVTLARFRDFIIGPKWASIPKSISANVASMSVAHLAGFNTSTVGALYQAGLGYNGETAGARIVRLCGEEGIQILIVGDLTDTEAMGPQQVKEFVEQIRDCEDVDQGILYEPRQFLGLAYRTRTSMLNQTRILGLDYTATHLSAIPEPTDDDQNTRNDVTATRVNGSSARVTRDSGALSIQAPPDGVGRYDEQLTVNAHSDEQLPQIAGWRVGIGTWDEERYPRMFVQLQRSVFTGDQDLTDAAAAADIGDLINLRNLPAWLPADQIDQLVQGGTEKLANFERELTWNCTPAGPYTVPVWDSAAARWDSSRSTLAVAFVAGTDTSMSVAVETNAALWVTGSAAPQFPIDVAVSGVRLRVTAISGASSPQTFTVQQAPINGVTKTIPAATSVRLFTPGRWAL